MRWFTVSVLAHDPEKKGRPQGAASPSGGEKLSAIHE